MILATAAVSVAAQQNHPNQAAPHETNAVTISGVVIQQGADYYIAEPSEMKPIAVLQGLEFNNGNFANYIGQQVHIRGAMSTVAGRRVFVVRTLGDIARDPAKQ
jgi:hypothetical protein